MTLKHYASKYCDSGGGGASFHCTTPDTWAMSPPTCTYNDVYGAYGGRSGTSFVYNTLTCSADTILQVMCMVN